MGAEWPKGVQLFFATIESFLIALVFTACAALVSFLRKHARAFGLVVSVLICGLWLWCAAHWLQPTIDRFRWGFLLWGLGWSAVLVALCLGGIAAVVVCLTIGNGSQAEQKQALIDWWEWERPFD